MIRPPAQIAHDIGAMSCGTTDQPVPREDVANRALGRTRSTTSASPRAPPETGTSDRAERTVGPPTAASHAELRSRTPRWYGQRLASRRATDRCRDHHRSSCRPGSKPHGWRRVLPWRESERKLSRPEAGRRRQRSERAMLAVGVAPDRSDTPEGRIIGIRRSWRETRSTAYRPRQEA